jgi:hypothetical protein
MTSISTNLPISSTEQSKTTTNQSYPSSTMPISVSTVSNISNVTTTSISTILTISSTEQSRTTTSQSYSSSSMSFSASTVSNATVSSCNILIFGLI